MFAGDRGGEKHLGEDRFWYHPPGEDFWMHLDRSVLAQEPPCVGEKWCGRCSL